MPLHISVPANSKHKNLIRAKAISLKSSIGTAQGESNGLSYFDEEALRLDVYDYSDALWNFLLELEPLNEVKSAVKGLLKGPSALELVTLGYPEPGKGK